MSKEITLRNKWCIVPVRDVINDLDVDLVSKAYAIDANYEEEAEVKGDIVTSIESVYKECTPFDFLNIVPNDEIEKHLLEQYQDEDKMIGNFFIFPNNKATMHQLDLLKNVARMIQDGSLDNLNQIQL